MNYRQLGRTDLKVSEVGFGAWAIGGNAHGNSYGPTDDAQSLRAIERALELGCTFFDTADVYGHGRSEELLGQVLGNRAGVVVATKVGGDFYQDPPQLNFSPDYVRFACEQSLKRLRRDTIDLYQLHNPPGHWMGQDQLYSVFEDLKAQGLIRFYGVSIFEPSEGVLAMRTGRPDTIQVVYNLFFQAPAQELFPLAQEQNVGIIAREPLANGFLAGRHTLNDTFPPGDIRHNWPREAIAARIQAADALRFLARGRTLAQAAIRFAIDHPVVSVAIPGAKTAEQVEENLASSQVPPLSAQERQQVEEPLEG